MKMTPAKPDDLIPRILEGEIPPTSDTMAFIVERANLNKEMTTQLMKQQIRLSTQLQAMNEKLLELQGVGKQYFSDIQVLLEENPKAPSKDGPGDQVRAPESKPDSQE